ncbi:MAG TPA: hypothetical protein VH062_01465 [Polyangiaceae bacterium]|jgi:hypothetical protein|nr:hypothetical protein [Polyangiaceae bacterium]
MTAVKGRPEACDVLTSYLLAKMAVVEAGFEGEITWQERRSFDDIDERSFLREAAWVVLSSGMRESVIRGLFPAVEAAFGNWRSGSWIVEHAADCKLQAMKTFRHVRKVDALVDIAVNVAKRGVEPLLAELRIVGPDALRALPYMGPATSRHLAKNLGIDIAKPDRHLLRVADATGYASPDSLCEHIGTMVGDTVAVVDLVIWRFATINADYLDFFRRRRCPGPQGGHNRAMPERSPGVGYVLHGPRCTAG